MGRVDEARERLVGLRYLGRVKVGYGGKDLLPLVHLHTQVDF